MLLQQPPQKNFGFVRDSIGGITCRGCTIQVTQWNDGVRAGVIWDEVCKWLGKPVFSARYFQLWWETQDLYKNVRELPAKVDPKSGIVGCMYTIQSSSMPCPRLSRFLF
jgi:hypothetical protein